MMTDSNLKNKHSETNVVRKRGNVRQEQADQLLEVLGHKIIGDERDLHDNGDDHDVSNVEKLSRPRFLVMLLSRTKTRGMRSLRRGL
jgi:hypothetical protein